MELSVVITSFSGQKIKYREAIVESLLIEGKNAPYKLVAVCFIPSQVKELLRKQEVKDKVVGVHSLERLEYAVDIVMHKLIESPGILMI